MAKEELACLECDEICQGCEPACLECGEEIYFEALATVGGEIVDTYDSCICSNRACTNSEDFAKYWQRIAKPVKKKEKSNA